MKTLFPLLFIGVLLFSCKKEDPVEPVNPGGPAVNWFTLGNQTYNMAGDDTGSYRTGSGLTYMNCDAPNAEMLFRIATTGTGQFVMTYPDTASAGAASVRLLINDTTLYMFTNVTVNITEYGAVGQKIKGNFSGDFFNFFYPSMDTLHANGEFSVTRIADQP